MNPLLSILILLAPLQAELYFYRDNMRVTLPMPLVHDISHLTLTKLLQDVNLPLFALRTLHFDKAEIDEVLAFPTGILGAMISAEQVREMANNGNLKPLFDGRFEARSRVVEIKVDVLRKRLASLDGSKVGSVEPKKDEPEEDSHHSSSHHSHSHSEEEHSDSHHSDSNDAKSTSSNDHESHHSEEKSSEKSAEKSHSSSHSEEHSD